MGTRLDKFENDPGTERALYLVTADKADEIVGDLEIPEGGFVCLLAWDADGVPDDVVSRVAKRLLDAGAKYVCTWGSGCERVHDLVDQAAFDPEADYDVEPVIMTTWHHDEPLESAVYFFLTDAHPDDECAPAEL